MGWKTSLSSGDTWYPHYTRSRYQPPAVGDLIAYRHAAWRVIAVNPVPEDQWTDHDRQAMAHAATRRLDYRRKAEPAVVVIRSAEITSTDVRARDHDKHLRHRDNTCWQVYLDEHYPVCATCHEPTPCREKVGERIATREMAHMARYEQAGVCPACQELVTTRQKSITFTENLEIPAGPPVTFHVGRRGCRYSGADYERRWVEADPKRRRTTLSCPGHVTNHNDGTYDCTELADCPGPVAFHPSYSCCRCPDCWTRGRFSCDPAPNARRNGAQ